MGGSPFDTLGFLKAVINMPTWPSAKKYYDRTNPPLMVSPVFALQPVENTMKYTIDDTDYVINSIYLIVKIQQLENSSHSHSIVAGGLLEMSYVTRDMPGTSLMIRLETFSSIS